MFGKGNKLYSISRWKCPRCHEGDIFKTPMMEGIYNMNSECPKCHQDFEIEPGFYWGAMYVGYGLSVGLLLSGFAVSIWGLRLTVNQSFVLVILLCLMFVPLIARMARVIWLNIYVHYNKGIAERVKAGTLEQNS